MKLTTDYRLMAGERRKGVERCCFFAFKAPTTSEVATVHLGGGVGLWSSVFGLISYV